MDEEAKRLEKEDAERLENLPQMERALIYVDDSPNGRLAARLARDYYRGVAAVFRQTGTFWENYAPDAYHQGEPARPDFCGWSAIAPITLYREYDV